MPPVPSLSPLRGIAALTIVVRHYCDQNYLYLPALTGFGAAAFVAKSYLMVDLFFLLSGYVIALVHSGDFAGTISCRAIARFLWIRLARIYPMYLATVLIMVAIRGDYGGGLVPSLLLVQAPWTDNIGLNFPAWSVSAEWHAYVAFPFIVAAVYFRSPRVAFASIAASIVVLVCLNGWLGSLNLADHVEVLFRAIPEFVIGTMIRRLQAQGRLPNLGPHALPIAIVALIASMALRCPDPLIIVLEAGLLAVAVQDSTSVAARVLNARPLVFLGEISYSVYINQIIVVEVARLVIRRFLIPGAFGTLGFREQLFALPCLVALLVAVSALTYRWIEVPARTLLRSSKWFLLAPLPQPSLRPAEWPEK